MSDSPTVGRPGFWLRLSQSSLPSTQLGCVYPPGNAGNVLDRSAYSARGCPSPPPLRCCHGSHDCGSSERRSFASRCHLLGDPADQGLRPNLKVNDIAIDALGISKRYCCGLPRLCVVYIDLEAVYDALNLLSGQSMYTESTPASWRGLRRIITPVTLPLSDPHSKTARALECSRLYRCGCIPSVALPGP